MASHRRILTAFPPRPASIVLSTAVALALTSSQAQQGDPPEAEPARGATSYMPVALERPFQEIYDEKVAEKGPLMQRAQALLESRYDLSDRPVEGVTMSGGKPVQGGVRVRLPDGVASWQELASM